MENPRTSKTVKKKFRESKTLAPMEKKIKYFDVEVSEKVVAKIRQEAERDLKKELFHQAIRKDYKCINPTCPGDRLPRPGDKNLKKCSYCLSEFFKNIQQFLPFQCQNTKYGCQEILEKEELFDHEKYCDYQKVHCPKIDCKTEIIFLNLLGKIFQLNSIFSIIIVYFLRRRCYDSFPDFHPSSDTLS